MSGTLNGLPTPGYRQLNQYLTCWVGLPSALRTNPLKKRSEPTHSDAGRVIHNFVEAAERLEVSLHQTLTVETAVLRHAIAEGERLRIWFIKYRQDFAWMSDKAKADYVIDDLFQLRTALTNTRSRLDRWERQSSCNGMRPIGLNTHLNWIYATIDSRSKLAHIALREQAMDSLETFFSEQSRELTGVLSARMAIRTYLKASV